MDKSNLNITIEKSVATISIHRAPVNALSSDLLKCLKDSFDSLENNHDVRIIVLKSKLSHFSAGADLKQRRIMTKEDSQSALDVFKECFWSIENSSKITICIINGYCLGGGAELALCFDFRIATPDAIIGFPEVGIGIIPGAGGTQRLPRLIGLANAKYWIYTANKFTADESLHYNFVNFIYDFDSLDAKTIELINKILSNSPYGVRHAKKSIQDGYDLSLKDGLEVERKQYNITVETKDRKEALKAFSEKRNPIWRNK